jgi:hypothetical protein
LIDNLDKNPTFAPQFKIIKVMGVTQFKRKALRNAAAGDNYQKALKRLTTKPPMKNVDIEAIKAEFAAKK